MRKRTIFNKIKNCPTKTRLEVEVEERKLASIESRLEIKKAENNDANSRLNIIKDEKKIIDSRRYNLAEKLMRIRDQLERKELEIEELQKDLDLGKQRVDKSKDEQILLSIEISQIKTDIREERHKNAKIDRQFDQLKKKYESLRRKKSHVVQDTLPLKDEVSLVFGNRSSAILEQP